MKKLPDINPKVKEFPLGEHSIEFEQITMANFNLFIDVQDAEKKGDQRAMMESILSLLAAIMHVDNTTEEKMAFLKSIDVSGVDQLTELIEGIMEFSGIEVDSAQVDSIKKKQVVRAVKK